MLDATVPNLAARQPGARDLCTPGIGLASSDVSEDLLSSTSG